MINQQNKNTLKINTLNLSTEKQGIAFYMPCIGKEFQGTVLNEKMKFLILDVLNEVHFVMLF